MNNYTIIQKENTQAALEKRGAYTKPYYSQRELSFIEDKIRLEREVNHAYKIAQQQVKRRKPLKNVILIKSFIKITIKQEVDSRLRYLWDGRAIDELARDVEKYGLTKDQIRTQIKNFIT